MAKQELEEWITSRDAAEILTENSGHQVSDSYVRLLGSKGKLETLRIDARTKLYKRSDVESYVVRQMRQKGKAAAS